MTVKPTCKTSGGELEAVVTWVHELAPSRRHPADPISRPAVEFRGLDDEPVREGTILHLVKRR
jgi:hypothetical protein